jgi:hypothetical protein
MTKDHTLVEAELRQRVKELEDTVARLQAKLLQYEDNENPRVAHRPTFSHDSNANSNRNTPPSSPTTVATKSFQSTKRLPRCKATTRKLGTVAAFKVEVSSLQNQSTASDKSLKTKGDKALDEIRSNFDTWCTLPASDIPASESNERNGCAPGTTLGAFIYNQSKTWAKNIATFVHELNQGEIVGRTATFYFLMLILAAVRLKLMAEDDALDLIDILTSKTKKPDTGWRRRLLGSFGQINDDIIVVLCKDGWTAAVVTKALAESKIVHRNNRLSAYSKQFSFLRRMSTPTFDGRIVILLLNFCVIIKI